MANLKLMQPQEIEVLFILPAVRKELARDLKELGAQQKDIAKLLYVQESTISQYFNEKRAKEIVFNDKIKTYIKECSKKIKEGGNMIMYTQSILKLARQENVLCQIHKKYSKIPDTCNMNKMGCC